MAEWYEVAEAMRGKAITPTRQSTFDANIRQLDEWSEEARKAAAEARRQEHEALGKEAEVNRTYARMEKDPKYRAKMEKKASEVTRKHEERLEKDPEYRARMIKAGHGGKFQPKDSNITELKKNLNEFLEEEEQEKEHAEDAKSKSELLEEEKEAAESYEESAKESEENAETYRHIKKEEEHHAKELTKDSENEWRCPDCGYTHKTDQTMKNEKTQCPECGHTVRVTTRKG